MNRPKNKNKKRLLECFYFMMQNYLTSFTSEVEAVPSDDTTEIFVQ